MKPLDNSDAELEDGEMERNQGEAIQMEKVAKSRSQALFSGLAYCICSCSMIFVNKLVLSSYNFNAGIFLMFYQNIIQVVIVSLLSYTGIVSTEPLSWKLIELWLHVNVIFVGMLITSMFSLKFMNVAMVTVLKNVTNVITDLGETYLYQKHHDSGVWVAIFLMIYELRICPLRIVSAISGGITDLSFDAVGYAWQLINCFLTASCYLKLRRVMDTAKQFTRSGNLNEISMVLFNSILSLPLGLLLISYTTPLLRIPAFWMVMTLSGILGLAISFTSLWFLHQAGATTYILVGSLNKIPLSVTGLVLFRVPISLECFASILFGLLAGVFFAWAKLRSSSS